MSLSAIFSRKTLGAIFAGFTLCVGSVVGGLAISAQIRLRVNAQPVVQPSRVIAVHSLNEDPRPGILDGIKIAKKEILISARTLGWENVLNALKARADAGVRVVVLLDGATNNDTLRGPLGWLIHYKVGEVFTSSPSLQEQVMIIDRTFVIVSSAPWVPGTPKIGVTFFMSDPAAALEYLKGYEKALTQASKFL